mgnify:CR=1 FL=1
MAIKDESTCSGISTLLITNEPYLVMPRLPLCWILSPEKKSKYKGRKIVLIAAYVLTTLTIDDH